MRTGIVVALMLGVAGLALGQPSLAATPAVAKPIEADKALKIAIDRFAADLLETRKAPGLSVGVMRDGRIAHLAGYGIANLETGTPVDERSVFRIGSVTKQFTAAAILLLAQDGRLSLEDPVAKYVPGFPRGDVVTLRQLLNHTSGIHNYTAGTFFREAARLEKSSQDMTAYIAAQVPLFDFEPGTAWRYSNSGYMLLGAVVEKVSGKPFDVFLHSAITEPLGLHDTRMDSLAEIVPHRVAGYDLSKAAPTGFTNAGFLSISAAGAAGGMRSTAADLLKWQDALYSHKLLKPAMLAEMTAPSVLKDGRLTSLGRVEHTGPTPPPDYGLGLAMQTKHNRRMIGHGGSINGFNAALQTFPDDRLSIVLLTNTIGAAYSGIDPLIEAVFAVQPQ